MKKQLTSIIISGIIFLLLNTGCKKQDDYLNAKPNDALAIPSSLSDLQSLLNNEGLFNKNDPGLGEISSDDYYVTPSTLNSQTTVEKNGYIWAKTVYDAGANLNDWNLPYSQIYTANTVLEDLPKMPVNSNQQTLADNIKGAALFYRSIAFYNLLQTFSMPYDPQTAHSDPGIPLRLTSDLNEKSVRANERQCYDQIIQDLTTALPLVPVVPIYKTQPSRPAVNALLSRIYLVTFDYTNALKYAGDCLSQYSSLVDYNTLKSLPSRTFLAEDIFHSLLINYSINYPDGKSIADTLIYRSFAPNDLRKTLLFDLYNGVYYFSGTYDIKGYAYSGIATDEVYLIRAECNARLGNTDAAMKDLNILLVNRWKANTFIPLTATSPDDALKQILTERKKELLYRGLRWTDLRRLNKDARFATTLIRNMNGVIYSLPPNDVRYAWPIPDNEITLSGLTQNAR